LTLPLVEPNGRINGLVQVITDITNHGTIEQGRTQQRNELYLLQDQVTRQNIELARINAELRRASRLKDEFLAGVSHEVRTPLTAILGMAELLRTEVIGPLNEQQTDFLQRMEESGRHLVAVINDLLDLAKIEAGQFSIDPNQLSVRHLCEASVRLVKQLALQKNHTLHEQIDERVQYIRADERRLRQALLNLLSNAIKFTPPNGTITLTVEGDPEHEVVRLSVSDTGVGIAAEDIPQLFQPFSQIDGDYQRLQSGSGLGLVLVARLAELHGGGVSLNSEPGVGSRFTISLPWTQADQQYDLSQMAIPGDKSVQKSEQATEPLPRSGHDETILLVEDDTVGGAVVTDYLQLSGYRIINTISGEEAMAALRRKLPQLMIVDLRMRGMDGLEVIRRVRAGAATHTIPIIVLTALAMPGDRERCMEAGADIYLSKPVQLRRLADLVAQQLGGRAISAGDSQQ
jgi:signal transduction histidine kinase/CheY-like chemotaxis protein